MFSADMTYEEAAKKFFSAMSNPDSNHEEIKKEYRTVLPLIINKELDGSPKFTSYKI